MKGQLMIALFVLVVYPIVLIEVFKAMCHINRLAPQNTLLQG
jgi:hypothetical protein